MMFFGTCAAENVTYVCLQMRLERAPLGTKPDSIVLCPKEEAGAGGELLVRWCLAFYKGHGFGGAHAGRLSKGLAV